MEDSITIDIPEHEWLTANGRYHWAVKAKRTKALRAKAARAAIQLRTFTRAHVTAFIAYPRGGRVDPANANPTVKAIIDGIVDAGALPDDDTSHLIGPDFRVDQPTKVKGLHRVRLVFTDQQHDF